MATKAYKKQNKLSLEIMAGQFEPRYQKILSPVR
jgi:hypothetical protein